MGGSGVGLAVVVVVVVEWRTVELRGEVDRLRFLEVMGRGEELLVGAATSIASAAKSVESVSEAGSS